MAKRRGTPWFSIVGGLVGSLTLFGIIFGNVAAYGKAAAKSEEVAKTVEKLDTRVEKHEEELNDVQADQQAVGKDIEAINDKLAEQRGMMQQMLDAVTKKR